MPRLTLLLSASLATGLCAGLALQPALSADPTLDAQVARDPIFLNAHPDQRFRALGMEARAQGRHAQARHYFRIAARFADKLSQAALAEMHRKGEGGPADAAIAYAWMDLAAERGTPWIVALREDYWAGLDTADRARAIRDGGPLYDELGDAVAKPRLETRLRTARRNVTGSRLGFIGNGLDIHQTDSLADATRGRALPTFSAEDLYADRFWQPEAYWAAQDLVLRTAVGGGTVDVGSPQTLQPRR